MALERDLSTLLCFNSSVSSSFRADMVVAEWADLLAPVAYLFSVVKSPALLSELIAAFVLGFGLLTVDLPTLTLSQSCPVGV